MIQLGAIITRSNITIYFTQHCSNQSLYSQNDTPYLALSGSFWVSVVRILKKGMRYNGIAIYQSIYTRLTRTTGCVYTVYPKKYAHGFCFAVLCCCYTLTDFPISIRLTSLALWQSNDCPSASKETLMNMDKYFMWIHYERLHNHNKAKHNKTVCIFLGIYCTARCSLMFWLLSFMWCGGLCDTYLGATMQPGARYFCMHNRWRQICTVFVIDMLTFITQINKWKYIIIWINAG